MRSQPVLRAAEIGPGENNASTDDANANFAGAIDRKDQYGAIDATSRTEEVAGNDRRRVAGQCGRIGVAEDRREEAADSAPRR